MFWTIVGALIFVFMLLPILGVVFKLLFMWLLGKSIEMGENKVNKSAT